MQQTSQWTPESITRHVGDIVLKRPITLGWLVLFLFAGAWFGLLFVALSYLFLRGIGIWGVNIPVAWGFAIANFVWWIGIGHAGTFISAILLLLKQDWRTSINRYAEAMTLFAVACAGLYPLAHLGRPQVFYFLLPYPDTMNLWPQFRSPLVWDIFAVFTYLTVSVLFWFLGMVPDLAKLREQAAPGWRKYVYGVLALGWRGSARHWRNYQFAYLLLAGIATPLVVSVHSVVSLDFTVAMVPGWHSTVFPPYFVVGAVFSGFAMVIVLGIPLRAAYKLHDFITDRHLDKLGQLVLAGSLFMSYFYAIEAFMVWYGGDQVDLGMLAHRAWGPHAALYWGLLAGNCIIPLTLWSARLRRQPWALFLVSLTVLIGMWLERVVIVITSLEHDFLPSAWGRYTPTVWDWATLGGTLGFFSFMFLLFARTLPVVATAELSEQAAEKP